MAKEIPISIPMMISKKRNLENIVGQNFLASLSAPEMSLSPIDPSNEYSLRVKVQLASSKPLEGYNRLTGGQVKVYVHVGVGEYEFHGIDKKKLSRKIFLPGVFLFENKRKEQNVKTEFFWESEVQGQFTAPDGMIGSKRFYDVSEDGEVIKGGFVYDIPGANWVSYLAAILGLQMLLWGGQIMRKHFGQMKNT
ncbi:MAG: hypothetical protein KAU41_10560 [Deltaproteobacteria bacterium]|nr:hypothetical protein [Deltaproteobacteria bacterium]